MIIGKKAQGLYGAKKHILVLVIGIMIGIVLSCIAGSLTNRVCGFIPL